MSADHKTDFLSTVPGILTAAVTANLLWGSASPCTKLGYSCFGIASEDVMGQILFAGVRFMLAGFLTVLFGSVLHRRILLPKPSSGRSILILAMMQTVMQYTFFYIGLSHAPGFKGSIISPTSTFFALLIAALVFRQENLTVKKLLGCHTNYYRYNRGEKLLNPKQQEQIRKLFRKYGYDTGIEFDHYVTTYDFKV